jgi:hypothetical protein
MIVLVLIIVDWRGALDWASGSGTGSRIRPQYVNGVSIQTLTRLPGLCELDAEYIKDWFNSTIIEV